MFGSKRSKQLRKFLSEKKSALADHNGVWLLGDNYDDLLLRYFQNLSPEFQNEKSSHLLKALAQVPSEKEQFDKTLKIANIPFGEVESPDEAYPRWVYGAKLPSAALLDISELYGWLITWRRTKRIEKVVVWVSELKHIERNLNVLLKNDVPSSHPLYNNLQYALNITRNLKFRVKALPADLHRESVWKHFELAFDDLNQNFKELKEKQLRWSNLYHRILKLFEDETDLKSFSFSAFSIDRLQSFLDKPSQSIYSFDDLDAALDDVKKALMEYKERAISTNPPINDNLFPGGKIVWGDLLTAPMPQGRYARLQEILVRSDILVGRLSERYGTVGQDLAENRADALFVSMLKNSELKLADIKAWLKKTKPKPKGTKRFENFLLGNLDSIQKLSVQYGDNEGFGPAIDAASWWFERNPTLPPYLPRWIDDLLEEWLNDIPEKLDRIFSRGWDRNVFALFTRISGTRPYIMEYLEIVWKILDPNERKRLWLTCPKKFKQKWLKEWSSKWFENGLPAEEIENGLNVYSIDEKLVLLDWYLNKDPLPEIEVLKIICDQLGKKVNSVLHQYLMQGFESKISPLKETTLVSMASEIFGPSLDLAGANSTFLRAILKTWKSNHGNFKFGAQVIADACWKLAVRGENIAELDLLLYKDIPVKTAGSLKLNSSQWNLLNPVFDNPEKLDFERIVTFMKWSVPTSIPLRVWNYLLLTLKGRGEQFLKEISPQCRRLLESAKESKKEEIASLATLLYWAYCFFSNECSAGDVPDHVLKIEVAG